MDFAPQCTLEPVLNLCVVGDFSLCEEAPVFLYPGLIVREISHGQGWTERRVGLCGHSVYLHYYIENVARIYAIKQKFRHWCSQSKSKRTSK